MFVRNRVPIISFWDNKLYFIFISVFYKRGFIFCLLINVNGSLDKGYKALSSSFLQLIVVGEITVDEMAVVETVVIDIAVVEIGVAGMTVGEMVVDEILVVG
jgi:hypothetical protein